jgi:hypothetical protein
MTNENSFGQRVAVGWRALVEHLNAVSAMEVAEESYLQSDASEKLLEVPE